MEDIKIKSANIIRSEFSSGFMLVNSDGQGLTFSDGDKKYLVVPLSEPKKKNSKTFKLVLRENTHPGKVYYFAPTFITSTKAIGTESENIENFYICIEQRVFVHFKLAPPFKRFNVEHISKPGAIYEVSEVH